jgi:hypothetical protein
VHVSVLVVVQLLALKKFQVGSGACGVVGTAASKCTACADTARQGLWFGVVVFLGTNFFGRGHNHSSKAAISAGDVCGWGVYLLGHWEMAGSQEERVEAAPCGAGLRLVVYWAM